jgi:hypothetical protein
MGYLFSRGLLQMSGIAFAGHSAVAVRIAGPTTLLLSTLTESESYPVGLRREEVMGEKTSDSKPMMPTPRFRSAYVPLIKRGQVKRRYSLGPYGAELMGRIESASLTDYLYVLAVFKEQATEPCLVVTSEVNADCWNIGGGSHFLCVFSGEIHSNMGASDDWADLDKFKSKALSLAAAELRVFESPQELLIASGVREPDKASSGRAV